MGVAQATSSMMDDLDERLLLHISYSPLRYSNFLCLTQPHCKALDSRYMIKIWHLKNLRWTCRNCSLASNISSSSLWPCDFKTGKISGSLQTFRCTYNFELRWSFISFTLSKSVVCDFWITFLSLFSAFRVTEHLCHTITDLVGDEVRDSSVP